MRGPLTVKLHTCPDTESQPAQPPKFDPFGFAVSEIVVPGAKLPVQVEEQAKPAGELATVLKPVPAKLTVTAAPVAVKHTTLAVMDPVMMAPEALSFPSLLVWRVADTSAFPHASPVAVSTPWVLTVTMVGVFEVQVTLFVMSFVTGG